MTKKTPSYLTKRGEIFYFQFRTSCHDSQKLIRRSTRTGNYREALKVARMIWMEIMINQNIPTQKEIEKKRFTEIYQRGEEVAKAKEVLSRHNPDLTESIDDEMSLEERHAIWFYKNYGTDPDASVNFDLPLSSTPPSDVNGLKVMRLSKLKDMFISLKMESTSPWAESSAGKYEIAIDLLIALVGDINSTELTDGMIEAEYLNKLTKMPTGWNRYNRYKDNGKVMPAKTIMAIAADDEHELFATKTIKNYGSNLKTFLIWAAKRKFVTSEWENAYENFDKMEVFPKLKRLPFSTEDQIKIFESKYYTEGLLWDCPERHWSPLIAQYTGMRRGEICKLFLKDIKTDEETGVIFFDIVHDPKAKRRAKTASSVRGVPIHDDLITLGFLNYIEQMKLQEEVQLFPNLSPNGNGEWGDEISTWFNEGGFREQCGVTVEEGEQKVFHSFRKTFINHGKQNMLNIAVRDQITGHSNGKRKVNASGEYELDFPLRVCKDYMNTVKYDFDISKIKKWPKP